MDERGLLAELTAADMVTISADGVVAINPDHLASSSRRRSDVAAAGGADDRGDREQHRGEPDQSGRRG